MANIDQLIKASSETYTALKDPKAISPKIDDYNSSVYYENPSYIYESYRENKML